MKILLVITKGEIGGAQVAVLNIAKQLRLKGMDVGIGSGEGAYLAQEAAKSDIPIIRFKWLKRTHNPLINIFYINELRKFLNHNRYDAVHFHSSNALIGGLGARWSKNSPKTVFTFHGLSMLDENYEAGKAVKYFYYLYFKFFLSYIDKKIFVCQRDYDAARKQKLVSAGTVIHNSLDISDTDFLPIGTVKSELENLLNISLGGKYLIGSIGRLAYPKNYEFLIGVFPKILEIKQNAVLIIIGGGPEKQKYQELIDKSGLGSSIFLAGAINDAFRYLKSFDLFVLPSIYEGLSLTLIETLAAGRPILASRVGGNQELLENSPDQLYELNNQTDFLEKFKQLVNDPQLAGRISNSNSRRFEDFKLENNIHKLMACYPDQF
jgi:glycosyltransferase involved in cell wall biosynthesis